MTAFVLIFIAIMFYILLIAYSILTLYGIRFRSEKEAEYTLDSYPSVAIFIPAHNEGKVINDTLDAMSRLNYPGKLDVFLLNDNSSDETGEIAQFFDDLFDYIHHILVPPGNPKGKSRVLNHGLTLTDAEYVAVYDADNQPEENALKLLVEAAERTKNACGAVGYVKTINANKNLLTRMIALEFQVFQLIMQSGRWKLWKLGSLTGTNMLVKRKTLEEVGCWDPYALAEDAELTLALTANGYVLPVVPNSVTWEQEPESFSVWFRQRTRWMRGNLYIITKTFKKPEWRKGRTLFHTVQLLSVYIIFVSLLLISHLWFVLGVFGLVQTSVTTPLLMFWYLSWLVYFVQLLSAETVDKTISLSNILVALIMYVTYAQLWIVLLIKGVYLQIKERKKAKEPVWDKTIRF